LPRGQSALCFPPGPGAGMQVQANCSSGLGLRPGGSGFRAHRSRAASFFLSDLILPNARAASLTIPPELLVMNPDCLLFRCGYSILDTVTLSAETFFAQSPKNICQTLDMYGNA